MTCNQNCNQGRNCNCDRKMDRATVVVATLLLICIVSMGFGVYQLLNGNTGSPCAVNVKFHDHTATYIGHSV